MLVLVLVMSMSMLTGCNLVNFAAFKAGQASENTDSTKSIFNNAKESVTNSVVSKSKLTQSNIDNGKKSAYEDAGFFERAGSWFKGMLTPGKTKYDYYAEKNPEAAVSAQKADYLQNNATLDEITTINKESSKIAFREVLIKYLPLILVIVALIVLLIFFISYRRSKKIPRRRKVHTEQLPPPPPPPPSAPVVRTGDVSVNYARGLKFYCNEHGLDYGDVVRQYGSEKAAFRALVSKT